MDMTALLTVAPRTSASSSLGDASETEEKVVKRRSKGFLANRQLTVDTKQKLIGDLIEKESRKASDEFDGSGCMSKQHPAAALQTPGMVLSVWGSATVDADRFEPYFAQKGINFDGEIRGMHHRIGLMSHRGFKPDSPNQDDFFVLARPESLLFGVMDGHGPNGHHVSHFAQERLPAKITEHLRKDGELWEAAVRKSVADLSDDAKHELLSKATDSGSTVTVAMLDRPSVRDGNVAAAGAAPRPLRLRCAHLGDSIVVHACRGSKSSQWEVTVLTDIHRPDRPDEEERINAAGGKVLPAGVECPRAPSRLLTPDLGLAMSRSFGDFQCASYGLSSEPEFGPDQRLDSDADHLVLMCSDGVWDVIPPVQAVSFVGKFRPDEAQLAVERLVAKAQRRWQELGDVVDDITAILVWPSFWESSDDAVDPSPVSGS